MRWREGNKEGRGRMRIGEGGIERGREGWTERGREGGREGEGRREGGR